MKLANLLSNFECSAVFLPQKEIIVTKEGLSYWVNVCTLFKSHSNNLAEWKEFKLYLKTGSTIGKTEMSLFEADDDTAGYHHAITLLSGAPPLLCIKEAIVIT